VTCYNQSVETYHVRTEVYEGPLDLLLSLIEKRRLLINDIALSEVTDDYLKHLEQNPDIPVAETAQFVLVGSTLLLIKSKSLLPVLSLTNDEQDSIVDLELRLKILDRYKTISRSLLETYAVNILHGRQHVKRKIVEFSPDASMTIQNLATAMHDVLVHLPKQKPTLTETVVKKVVSLEEMMDKLSERINRSLQVSFRQFSSNAPEGKLNVIVTFLAMLELVRQGVIRVEQHEKFSDIKMHADVVTMPSYK
jgi:segregation and condensation protein A